MVGVSGKEKGNPHQRIALRLLTRVPYLAGCGVNALSGLQGSADHPVGLISVAHQAMWRLPIRYGSLPLNTGTECGGVFTLAIVLPCNL